MVPEVKGANPFLEKVEFCAPGPERTLFVAPVLDERAAEMVCRLASSCGLVYRTVIMLEKKCMLVSFFLRADAELALVNLNRFMVCGTELRPSFSNMTKGHRTPMSYIRAVKFLTEKLPCFRFEFCSKLECFKRENTDEEIFIGNHALMSDEALLHISCNLNIQHKPPLVINGKGFVRVKDPSNQLRHGAILISSISEQARMRLIADLGKTCTVPKLFEDPGIAVRQVADAARLEAILQLNIVVDTRTRKVAELSAVRDDIESTDEDDGASSTDGACFDAGDDLASLAGPKPRCENETEVSEAGACVRGQLGGVPRSSTEI